MPGEIIALSRFQSGTEATPGTGVPATRIDLINPGAELSTPNEFYKPNEVRNSYTRNYRSFQVKELAAITGMQVSPTYEALPRYLQAGAKGGVTGGVGDAGTPIMYTYTFNRNDTANDLKHFTWEVGGTVQCYQVVGAVLDRWDMGFTANGPMTMSMDWLALRAIKSTFTAALSDVVVEDIIGATAIVYIDSTTVGTTAAAYALDFKFSVANNYQQLPVLNGNLYPKENYRAEPSFAALDMKVAFDTVTEYDKFVTSRGQRKIRATVLGSTIHDAVKKALVVDWYGFWDAHEFGSENGMRVANLKGESHYDTTAAQQWQVAVKNALATLP